MLYYMYVIQVQGVTNIFDKSNLLASIDIKVLDSTYVFVCNIASDWPHNNYLAT